MLGCVSLGLKYLEFQCDRGKRNAMVGVDGVDSGGACSWAGGKALGHNTSSQCAWHLEHLSAAITWFILVVPEPYANPRAISQHLEGRGAQHMALQVYE